MAKTEALREKRRLYSPAMHQFFISQRWKLLECAELAKAYKERLRFRYRLFGYFGVLLHFTHFRVNE